MTQRPLRTPLDALAVASAAFHRGDFEFALRAVEEQPPTTAAHCLRSSILRRLRRVEGSHQAAQLAASAVQDDEDRALAACTVATSLMLQGRDNEASERLEAVESIREYVSDFARGRIGFTRALMAWKSEDAVAAESHMMEAYRCPEPFERLCSYQLHGFIYHLQGRSRDAVDMFVKALRESDKTHSVPWIAELLMNLTFLTSEIEVDVRREGEPMRTGTHKHETVDLPDLRRRIRELPWTENLYEHRFWASRNLGSRLVLDNGVSAHLGLILLQQSAEVATTAAQRVLALLGGAEAAFHLREPEHGAAYLRQAEEAIPQIAWEREDEEERLALLTVAELTADRNNERAQGYLARFHGLPPLNGMMALSHGNRLPAMIAHAEGMVARYGGDTAKAIERFRFALKTFSGIGYKWRASSAALNLFEITGDSRYALRADELAKSYPQSWLCRLHELEHPP